MRSIICYFQFKHGNCAVWSSVCLLPESDGGIPLNNFKVYFLEREPKREVVLTSLRELSHPPSRSYIRNELTRVVCTLSSHIQNPTPSPDIQNLPPSSWTPFARTAPCHIGFNDDPQRLKITFQKHNTISSKVDRNKFIKKNHRN